MDDGKVLRVRAKKWDKICTRCPNKKPAKFEKGRPRISILKYSDLQNEFQFDTVIVEINCALQSPAEKKMCKTENLKENKATMCDKKGKPV